MAMAVKVALFGNRGSAQVAEIAQTVSAEGATPLILDLRIGGTTLDSDQPALALTSESAFWDGTDFSDIRVAHIRCTTPRVLPTLPAMLNPVSFAEYRAQYLKEQLYQAATYAFFQYLAARGTLVINPLTGAFVDHNSKSQFYEKLRSAGFVAPRSLSTNDPDAAIRFINEVGEAVMKPAIGVGSTRVVSEADRLRFAELPRCPTLFQERILGNTIRIHIVGDTMVLALRIIAEGVDSRTGTKDFEVIDLPEEEAAAIVRANRMLGLHYAAWDAIQQADGRLCYLDCNPGPFLGWLPEANRKAVFGHLARYMITFAETGSVADASAAVCAASRSPAPTPPHP